MRKIILLTLIFIYHNTFSQTKPAYKDSIVSVNGTIISNIQIGLINENNVFYVKKNSYKDYYLSMDSVKYCVKEGKKITPNVFKPSKEEYKSASTNIPMNPIQQKQLSELEAINLKIDDINKRLHNHASEYYLGIAVSLGGALLSIFGTSYIDDSNIQTGKFLMYTGFAVSLTGTGIIINSHRWFNSKKYN